MRLFKRSAPAGSAASDEALTLAYVNGMRAVNGHPPLAKMPENRPPIPFHELRASTCPVASAVPEIIAVDAEEASYDQPQQTRRIRSVRMPEYVRRMIRKYDKEVMR